MQQLQKYLTSVIFSPLFPYAVFGLLLVLVVYYFFAKKEKREKYLKRFIFGAIAFRVLYAFALSGMQYYVWSQEKVTSYFLPPTSPITYFLFYSWGRFWMNFVLVLGVSIVWYFILKSLQRYRSSLFENGEIKLGFLCAFLVGWPNVVLIIPVFFIAMIFVSLFRRIFFKKQFTTIGIPLLVSTVIVFIFGTNMIELLQLGVLKI